MLVDGSRARQPPVELGGIDLPAVLTGTRTRGSGPTVDARIRSCAEQGWSPRPSGPAVLRTGVDGESVTFGGGARGAVHACDDSSREASATWCGVAFGRRVGGRLLDPRLDLGGCFSADGLPVAFVWVEPADLTRYVVVRHDAYAEVYEVAEGLPVRVTTKEDVDLERSRATFDVSEHAASGALLRTYVLTAATAG